jgi:LEA14-like dessication related protein
MALIKNHMMKNIIYKLIVVAVSFLFLVSCSKIEDLKIGNVHNVEFKGMTNGKLSFIISVPIENPNSLKIKLKDADFTVTANGSVLGKINQTEPLTIEGKSSKDYSIPLNVELTGPNANLLSLYSLFNSKPDILITGAVKVRSGIYRKKFALNNYTIKY